MIYLTPGYHAMNENRWPSYWGHLFTPAEFRPIVEDGRLWAVDNGVFTRGFDWADMKSFLESKEDYKSTCKFVVVPDVIGNAIATMCSYRHWAWRIKEIGWPVAFVAQDGQEQHDIPECDVLFVGGTTDWKMGEGAWRCIRDAKKKDCGFMLEE